MKQTLAGVVCSCCRLRQRAPFTAGYNRLKASRCALEFNHVALHPRCGHPNYLIMDRRLERNY